MLEYNRSQVAGEHCWYATDGIALWKGHSAWYYRPAGKLPQYLCPLAWPDGDAIELYRAKVRIQEARTRATQTAQTG